MGQTPWAVTHSPITKLTLGYLWHTSGMTNAMMSMPFRYTRRLRATMVMGLSAFAGQGWLGPGSNSLASTAVVVMGGGRGGRACPEFEYACHHWLQATLQTDNSWLEKLRKLQGTVQSGNTSI